MYEHSNDDKNKLTNYSISSNENHIRAYNTSTSL
jgi:hypothetical protein